MKGIKGSYTVEAALILPLILIVLVGVLYIAFYTHDAVWLQGAAYESAFMGANGGRLEDWRVIRPNRQEVLEYLQMKTEGRQILSAAIEYEVTEGEKQVKVSVKGKQTVSALVSGPTAASHVRKMEKLIKMLESGKEQEE